MQRLTWSIKALADIERLDAFLRAKNPGSATRAIAAILDSVEALQTFPATGRPVEGMDQEYRELPVAFGSGGYLIFYRENDSGIHVPAVRHMREVGY